MVEDEEGAASPELAEAVKEFGVAGFDAKRKAREYYRQGSDVEVTSTCASLAKQRHDCSQLLARKVFRYGHFFLTSADDLENMESRLSQLRRTMGKTEYLLSTIETAANNLDVEAVGLHSSTSWSDEERHEQEKSSLPDLRFKQILALSSTDDHPLKWLLESPRLLSLKLHQDSLTDAIEIINRAKASQVSGEGELMWAAQYAQGLVAKESERLSARLAGLLEDDDGVSSERLMRAEKQKHDNINEHPVMLLRQLGLGDLACSAFLRGKSRRLQRTLSEITSSSLATEPEQCMVELGQAIFGGILDTHREFQRLFSSEQDKAFPDAWRACFAMWTKEHCSRYIATFVRFLLPGCASEYKSKIVEQREQEQARDQPQDSNWLAFEFEKPINLGEYQKENQSSMVLLSNDEWRVLGNCLRWTLLLCKRLEKEGVSLSFLVARQLQAPLNAALDSIFVKAGRSARFALDGDTFKSEQLRVESREGADELVLSLTSSGQTMYQLVHDLIRKIKRIYSTSYSTATASLESRITNRLVSLLDTYMANLVHASGAWPVTIEDMALASARRGDGIGSTIEKIKAKLGRDLDAKEERVVAVLVGKRISESQALAILANVLFVSTDLAVRARENIEKLFRRPVPSLREFEGSFKYLRACCDAFESRTASRLLEDVLQWSHFDYQSSTPPTTATESGVVVSANFARLVASLTQLRSLVEKRLGKGERSNDLLASIVDRLLEMLFAGGPSQQIFGPVRGKENKKRFAADLRMLVEKCEELAGRAPKEKIAHTIRQMITEHG